jgi:hypothetical protein
MALFAFPSINPRVVVLNVRPSAPAARSAAERASSPAARREAERANALSHAGTVALLLKPAPAGVGKPIPTQSTLP